MTQFKLISCDMDSDGSYTLELLTAEHDTVFASCNATFYDNPPYFGVDQVKLDRIYVYLGDKPADVDVRAWLNAHKPLVHAAILEQFELNAANEHTLCGGWE